MESILPRIVPLRFRLETLSAFRVPEYKGALFRGGFGQFFRDLVCVTRMPICTGCEHLAHCPYSLVFETPVAPERFAVLRKYPNAPHPFVLTPPLDARTSLGAGVELRLEVTLIGHGAEYLPHFVKVIEAMGQSGRYGGRFRLRCVESAVNGAVVYDGSARRLAETAPAWRETADGARAGRMRITFLTPLRMRTGGRYNGSPDFVEITHALVRRAHLLAAIYGEGDAEGIWTRPLLALADAVKTESARFELYRRCVYKGAEAGTEGWSRDQSRHGNGAPEDQV